MVNSPFFEQLSQKIAALLPIAGELGDDLRTNLGQLLQASFEELNLLTKQQFEAQAGALQRAEQRIDELAAEIASLDEKVASLEAEADSK